MVLNSGITLESLRELERIPVPGPPFQIPRSCSSVVPGHWRLSSIGQVILVSNQIENHYSGRIFDEHSNGMREVLVFSSSSPLVFHCRAHFDSKCGAAVQDGGSGGSNPVFSVSEFLQPA